MARNYKQFKNKLRLRLKKSENVSSWNFTKSYNLRLHCAQKNKTQKHHFPFYTVSTIVPNDIICSCMDKMHSGQ